MCNAPFRELLTLIVLDGDANLPQYLLVRLADRRSQRPNRGRGIEIENRYEVLMLKILVCIQSAAGHQGVGKPRPQTKAPGRAQRHLLMDGTSVK